MGWVVGIVLLGGLDYMFLRRIRGEAVQIGDVFAGFNIAFLHLALAGLVKWLLTSLGLVLCILPGIYLAVGIRVRAAARHRQEDGVLARHGSEPPGRPPSLVVDASGS